MTYTQKAVLALVSLALTTASATPALAGGPRLYADLAHVSGPNPVSGMITFSVKAGQKQLCWSTDLPGYNTGSISTSYISYTNGGVLVTLQGDHGCTTSASLSQLTKNPGNFEVEVNSALGDQWSGVLHK